MSQPANVEDALSASWDSESDFYTEEVAEDAETGSSLSLFPGDEGGLSEAQRRTALVILKQRFITSASHPQEWATLTSNPTLIKSRLNDLFMDLHLDGEHEVAFKKQAREEGPSRFPTLLHDLAYSREETLLLVFLRKRMRSEISAGADQVIVDRQELLDYVAGFRPENATDVSGDVRRVENAVDSLLKAHILGRTADVERLSVSPVLEVLLPLPKLAELLDWLMATNSDDSANNDQSDAADQGTDAADVESTDEDLR